MMREVMRGRFREGGRGLLHPNNHPKPTQEGGRGLLHPNNHPKPTQEGGRGSKLVNPHPKPLLVSRPRFVMNKK